MTIQIHPTGDYSFVPGIAPYSCGAISNPGFEIVYVTLRTMVSWSDGFRLIESFLDSEHRPKSALCAVSLRSPVPFSFDGFAEFNSGYASVLNDWGVFVDGVNPVARTNVVPVKLPPTEPSLHAFAFTTPCPREQPATFVVAGAGELPEGILCRGGIHCLHDITPQGLARKAEFVMSLMENRLQQLQTNWTAATRINVYTIHSIDHIVRDTIEPRIGSAAIHGINWHDARPPIKEIEYEMDVRGVARERIVS